VSWGLRPQPSLRRLRRLPTSCADARHGAQPHTGPRRAPITVRNLTAQDEAKDKISEFYTAQGCRWREIDRRKDPRFGYRGMHLVVHVDGLPVEIQIRTELQDSWAQIFERLGDRWGRGIRYGQDPENIVRSGKSVYTRRELLALLMTLLSNTVLIRPCRKFELPLRRVPVTTLGYGHRSLPAVRVERLWNGAPRRAPTRAHRPIRQLYRGLRI
jgi:hypothetical protein